MRLIDAEKLEKFIEDGLNNPDKNKRFGHDAIEIMTEVHFSETVDVAPETHGRWIMDGKDHCHCSECRDGRNIRTQIGWRFCPNCGAKMDLSDGKT